VKFPPLTSANSLHPDTAGHYVPPRRKYQTISALIYGLAVEHTAA
jgi:hypothetical protein